MKLNIFYSIFSIIIMFQWSGPDISTAKTTKGFSMNDSLNRIKAVNSKSGILYLGIDNRINVQDNYFYRNDVFLKTNNGRLFKDSTHYIIIPRKLPRADIFVYEINGKDTSLIHEQRFKVKYVPRPCITIGGKCLEDIGTIDRRFFLINDTLGVYITDDVKGSENWVQINRFTLGYVYGSVYVSFNSNDNKITEEMKQAIMKLRPGQEISLRVNIESEGRVTRNLPVYSVTII